MLFNSYVFVFAFLPLVFGVYCLVRKHPTRTWTIAWLVLASLVYYAWWKPEFLLLLVLSITVNAVFGALLCRGHLSRGAARAVLTAGIVFNLGLLGYFKYAGFFVQNLNTWLGAGFTVPTIILPIGISFITFQKIAFLVDAYHGAVRGFSLANYALFVTFFPQLIAGPIVHHAEVMPQFSRRQAPGTLASDVAVGLSIFAVGLFKKVVVADSCAVYANAGYDTLRAGHALDPAAAWVAVIAYSFQLYYDFSGYSDMAIGLARLFGIRFPVNFHSPYKATGIIEFWRRWHMTLSRFLRDYLYIPLGGSRRGALRQYLNLAAVMLLGGLWHGANWTFVVWGAVHGALLAVNHAWTQCAISRSRLFSTRLATASAVLLTFLAVTLAWVPFRSDSLADASRMFAALFSIGPGAQPASTSFSQLWTAQVWELRNGLGLAGWFTPRELWPPVLPPDFLTRLRPAGLLLVGVGLATFLLPNTSQIFARFDPVLGLSEREIAHPVSLERLDWKVAAILSAMFVLCVLKLSHVSPFLYFQF